MSNDNNEPPLPRLRFSMPVKEATVDDVDLHRFRTIDETKWRELVTCRWLQLHQNLWIEGPSGIGKTFVASALGHQAARAGYRVLFSTGARLAEVLCGPGRDATRKDLHALKRKNDLLIIDEFSPSMFVGDHWADTIDAFLENRQFQNSIMMVTGLPLAQWGNPSPSLVRLLDHLLAGAQGLELRSNPCLRRR